MTGLVEFLRAQLDTDEQAARATTGPWKYHRETGGVVLPTAGHIPEIREIVATPREPSDARHMVRWDSARVLAEVAAKRRLIADYEQASDDADAAADLPEGWSRAPVEQAHALARRNALYAAMEYAVLPYAGRPGFQEAWRP